MTEMFDKLENYLNKWVTPERRECIMNALTVLHAYGSEAAWNEICVFLEHATDRDTVTILDTIETIITVGLDKLIDAHGILYIGTMASKTRVLEGLLILQNYADEDSLLRHTERTDNPVEILADLLELATTTPWTEFIDGIRSVSPGLFTKLASLYTVSDESDESASLMFLSGDRARVDKVSRFVGLHPATMAARAILEDFRPVGLPLNILINDHRLEFAALEPMGFSQAALELVGLVLISDTPLENLLTVSKDQIETIFADINFITKVEMSMDVILTEVSRYE